MPVSVEPSARSRACAPPPASSATPSSTTRSGPRSARAAAPTAGSPTASPSPASSPARAATAARIRVARDGGERRRRVARLRARPLAAARGLGRLGARLARSSPGPLPASRGMRNDRAMRALHVDLSPHVSVVPRRRPVASRDRASAARCSPSSTPSRTSSACRPTWRRARRPTSPSTSAAATRSLGEIEMPSGPRMWRMERPAELAKVATDRDAATRSGSRCTSAQVKRMTRVARAPRASAWRAGVGARAGRPLGWARSAVELDDQARARARACRGDSGRSARSAPGSGGRSARRGGRSHARSRSRSGRAGVDGRPSRRGAATRPASALVRGPLAVRGGARIALELGSRQDEAEGVVGEVGGSRPAAPWGASTTGRLAVRAWRLDLAADGGCRRSWRERLVLPGASMWIGSGRRAERARATRER